MYRVTAAVMGGLLALAGCSSGEDSGSAALSRRSTTTTSVPTTETTQGRGTVAPATTRPQATDGSLPHVVATPARGAPGTRVRIEGSGFTEAQWRTATTNLWLAGSVPNCALFAQAEHSVTVTSAGRLTGEFVVPANGSCRQGASGDVPLTSGGYDIVFQCTACTIGTFEVTGVSTAVRCSDVGFTPNSDNLASEIMATGLSCAEAEAVVRKVGPPLGPVNGLPRAEADGFQCVRTSESDGRGLPSATYECTNGSKRITFVRT